MVDIQTQLLDEFLAYKKQYDSASPQARKKMSYPRPKKSADLKFDPVKFPKENIPAIQATEPKKPAHMTGSGMEGGRDYSQDEGKSLGFFGNLKRAFSVSANKKPQSQAEKDALNFTLNYLEPVALAPLHVLAPPVGAIGEAQRQGLKKLYDI